MLTVFSSHSQCFLVHFRLLTARATSEILNCLLYPSFFTKLHCGVFSHLRFQFYFHRASKRKSLLDIWLLYIWHVCMYSTRTWYASDVLWQRKPGEHPPGRGWRQRCWEQRHKERAPPSKAAPHPSMQQLRRHATRAQGTSTLLRSSSFRCAFSASGGHHVIAVHHRRISGVIYCFIRQLLRRVLM